MKHLTTKIVVMRAITLFALAISAAGPSLAQELPAPAPGPEITSNVIDMQASELGVCLLQADNTLFCWNKKAPFETLDFQSLNNTLNNDIKAFSLGDAGLCAIGNESGVACVYDEDFYTADALADIPEPGASYIAISAMNFASVNVCAIQTDNRVVCWGHDSGMNDVPAEAQYLKQIDVIYFEACGIDLNDKALCWGPYSQDSPIDHALNPELSSLGEVKDIALSFVGTCALKSDNTVQCYGDLSEYTDALAGQTFTSIDLQRFPANTALCYEDTTGVTDCVAGPDPRFVSSQPFELNSVFPSDTNPRHSWLKDNTYVINEDGSFHLYDYLGQKSSLFPTAPTNLRAEVYSGSALELFWDRAANHSYEAGYVNGYEIYRDNVLIAAIGAQTSYFDNNFSETGVDTHNYTLRPLLGNVAGISSAIEVETGSTGVGTTPPTPSTTPAPNNLHSIVYSAHSAEIFWDRAANPLTTYDVYRDGTLIREGMYGLSVFEPSLIQNKRYLYTVVAIVNGIESEAATSYLATPPIAGVEPSAVQAPQNLTLTRYSSTALELFWDRSDAQSGVHSFEVFRNGERMRTLTGISYFDDTASAETQWTYTVVAIDEAGQRSDKVFVTAN